MTCQDSCDINFLEATFKFYTQNDAAITFLREHGVLPNIVTCPRCEKNCKLNRGEWKCQGNVKIKKTKRFKRCGYTKRDYKGTFLHGTHLPAWKIVCFANQWLNESWNHHTVIKCLKITRATSVDWRSFCSEVTDKWFSEQEAIGGVGVEVEIDETLIAKRKYHRGRILGQIWVFGGIERISKKKFVIPLLNEDVEQEKRSKETLLPLITKYIKPGSIIYSDSWKPYHDIPSLGYQHFMINHSEKFVDGPIHTQNIERFWRSLKESVKRPGIIPSHLRQYISRFLFLDSIKEEDQRLHFFFNECARLSPPAE